MVWALGQIGVSAQIAGAIVVSGVSVWSASAFAHAGSESDGDPGWVVVDEAAGTMLATIGLGWPFALVGWLVFRVADIFKTRFPGVAAAEGMHGGLGITADDLVAGLYGLAAGWILQTLFG